VIPLVRKRLKDPDVEERRQALSFLVNLRSAAFISDIALRLADAEPTIRDAAFGALRELGAPALPHVIRLAGDPSFAKRREALWTIERLGPAAGAALDVLLANLDDPDPDLRRASASAISAVAKDSLPVARLLRSMRKALIPDSERTLALLRIMQDSGRLDRAAVPFLKAQLFATDEKVRVAAIHTVPKLGEDGRGLVWTLIEKIEGAPSAEEDAAYKALESFTAATPILIEGLVHSRGDRRRRVAWLLGKRRAEAAAALPWLNAIAARDDDEGDAARTAAEQIQGTETSSLAPRPAPLPPALPRSDEHMKDAVAADRSYCRKNRLAACIDRGIAFAEGRTVARDPVRAARFFQCGYDQRDADAAVRLGAAYLNGEGLAVDTDRAMLLFRQACDAGHGGGCSYLGLAHDSGEGGVPKDPQSGAVMYAKSCELGDHIGCFNLGVSHFMGGAPSSSLSQAVTYYERGCKGGFQQSCEQAEAVRDLRVHEVACENGDGARCTKAGDTVRWSARTPRNPPLALAFFERGCALGNGSGCFGAGFAHEKGEGTAPSATRAADLYAKACELRNPYGCSGLAELYERGEGVPADAAQARALKDKACTYGYKDDCAE
jgi:TPR repeat protein